MKIFILIIFISSLVFSKVYYSKLEPYEIRDISSQVSGLITYVSEDDIGKKLADKPYIKMDTIINNSELKAVQEKFLFTKDIVSSNEKVLINLKKSLDKKRENYKKVVALKIKSIVEKDREFHDLVNSENSYLNTLKEINNLKIQLTDLKFKEIQLKRVIEDKNLHAKGFTLYSIFVKPGQVVGISTPLAQIADISRAKLTIFLDEADILNATNMDVYLDGVKSKYKLSRVLNIADSKNISKYKAQIIIPSPKLFSKLIKIELKDKVDAE